MKNYYLKFSGLFFLMQAFMGYAQNSFKKGYYITNSNERKECFIKDIGWKNTPQNFQFKITKEGEISELGIDNVIEFGVNKEERFKRANVFIDKSVDDLRFISDKRAPEFVKKTVFLEILVKGDATLYIYKKGVQKKFFYEKDKGIEQLVFKRFKYNYKIKENNYYKQQLFKKLKCNNDLNFNNLNYTSKSLIELFVNYNKCKNLGFKYEENNNIKSSKLSLNLRPRINFINVDIVDLSNNSSYSLGSKNTFGIGAELEYTLGVNNNKWSLTFEPNYQVFKVEKDVQRKGVAFNSEVNFDYNYSAIELPFGVRHYFFLNKKESKLFINASFAVDLIINPSLDISINNINTTNPVPKEDFGNNFSLGLGFGYKYNDKYSIELRYNTEKDALGNSKVWSVKHNPVSLILGMKLF